MRRQVISSVFVLGGLVVLIVARPFGRAQQSASPPLRYLLTARDGVVIHPPALVAAGNVLASEWSPDGRYILAVRRYQRPPVTAEAPPVAAEISLTLWNAGSQRAQEIWKTTLDANQTLHGKTTINWLPTRSIAAVKIAWVGQIEGQDDSLHQTLLWANATQGQAREIPQTFDDEVEISPTLPLALLYQSVVTPGAPEAPPLQAGQENEPAPIIARQFYVVQADGRPGPAIALPKNMIMSGTYWTADGAHYAIRTLQKTAGGEKKEVWLALDARAGTLATLDKRPEPYKKPSSGESSASGAAGLRVQTTSGLLKAGETTETVHPLWLESEAGGKFARVLLCADGENGKVGPNGDAILYQCQGFAWVAPLTRVPKAKFLEVLRERAKSHAKTVGTALAMYVQDYDETFPPADGNVVDRVEPYAKDRSAFDGFNYTFNGGTLASLGNPAETVVGSIDAPGGVVQIYADGHVVWQDK